MALTTQRVDVPVIVDESKCLEKCTACIEVCPLDVLVKNPETGKAYMKYDECWFCLPCEKECPTNAITVSNSVFIALGRLVTDDLFRTRSRSSAMGKRCCNRLT